MLLLGELLAAVLLLGELLAAVLLLGELLAAVLLLVLGVYLAPGVLQPGWLLALKVGHAVHGLHHLLRPLLEIVYFLLERPQVTVHLLLLELLYPYDVPQVAVPDGVPEVRVRVH